MGRLGLQLGAIHREVFFAEHSFGLRRGHQLLEEAADHIVFERPLRADAVKSLL